MPEGIVTHTPPHISCRMIPTPPDVPSCYQVTANCLVKVCQCAPMPEFHGVSVNCMIRRAFTADEQTKFSESKFLCLHKMSFNSFVGQGFLKAALTVGDVCSVPKFWTS